MKDFKDYFKAKRITVMRIGLIGRGIGDTAFMAEAGAEILVVDDASQAIMQPAVDALQDFKNITFKFGPYQNTDFENCDFVLVGAGAPLDLPCLVHARSVGTRLVQSAALFALLSGVPIIGVTGTRGKSTVTHMIHHVLTQTTEGAPVLLGGNVRGVSNLQLLKEVEEDSLAVMELDSWQLQGFGWAKISPHIAVFTTFMEDHMNYYIKRDPNTTTSPREVEYGAGMDAYFADKANIFWYQEESGVFVTTQEVCARAQAFMKKEGEEFHQEIKLVDASLLPEDCILAMPGEHNRLNAALATEALRATGLTDEEIFEGLATFPGVPGRLEYLGELNGIRIYNDNNATTPQATIEGLKAVSKDKNCVLIAGGADKDIDLTSLVSAIETYARYVILLAGTGTEKLRNALISIDSVNRINLPFTSLKEAIDTALAKCEHGDVLLFSPGFASFGMFVNEYDRNDQFVKIIRDLQR